MKSVRISRYAGPYFLSSWLNTEQNNSKYGHFQRSVTVHLILKLTI